MSVSPYITVGAADSDFITDGTADNVQIQAAIDALTASGGTVFIKQGAYSMAAPTILKSNVRLMGAGMFQTKLVAAAGWTSGAVLNAIMYTPQAPLQRATVCDLEIDCSNMPTEPYQIGRKGIEGNNFQRCTFQNLYIHDAPATGLGIDNLDQVLIDHCYIRDCGTPGQPQGSNGIGLGTGGNIHESFIVTNCINQGIANSAYLAEDLESVVDGEKFYLFCNNISLNDFTGFSISGCDNVTVANNAIYNPSNIGIRAIDFVTHFPEHFMISGNRIDSANSYGIEVQTHARNFTIANNTVTNGSSEGVVVRGANGVIQGNEVCGNGKHGIFLGGGPGGTPITNIIIADNIAYNNSLVAANSDGIRLDGQNVAIADITIQGNHCFDNQATKTQRYGVILTGGSGHSAINVRDNNVRGNKTGGFLRSNFAMTSPSLLTVRGNLGVNPDSGYAQGDVSGATTFNRINGSQITARLTGNISVTLPPAPSEGEQLTLKLTQDNTGSRLASWPANFKKAGGVLTLSTAAGAVDIIQMQYDGINWVETSRTLDVR